jgi:PLP dependent protein
MAHARIRAMRPPPTEIAENLAIVQERIERAASRAGRRAGEITLIAVSKTHPARRIRQLYEAGVRHFAENRIQEREFKLSHVANLDIVWHMIGHVQKNKAARAARLFETVDSVDSLALAEKLDRATADFITEQAARTEQNPESSRPTGESRLRVLIEVKLDPEPAKSGAQDDEVPKLATALLRLPHLELRGLMGVPPYFDNPDEARPYFRRLREMRDATRDQMKTDVLHVLSMGMSHDFEIAIEEGATEIRVGTALFGVREPK